MAILATGIGLGAIYAAHMIYSKPMPAPMEKDPLEINPQTQPIFALSNARLYWDESYFKYIVYPFQRAARFLANTIDWDFWHNFVHDRLIGQGFQGAADVISQPVDRQIVDKGFMSLASGVLFTGSRLRKIQTGYVRTYALSLMVGVLLVIVIILLPTLRELLGI
jgi:NADH:ubiquinone oxidoreductase subunit 5 (subunit L)/multisubunit Na+/H+ antiporter MnhA subunit